jgi:hypothetical protein
MPLPCRSAGSNSSSRAAWPQSAADGDLAGSSSSARAAAAAAAGPGSVHSSASEDVLGALQAKGATHHLWGSAEQQQQQQWPGQQSGGQGWAGQGLGPGPEAVDLAQLEGVRAVPQEVCGTACLIYEQHTLLLALLSSCWHAADAGGVG